MYLAEHASKNVANWNISQTFSFLVFLMRKQPVSVSVSRGFWFFFSWSMWHMSAVVEGFDFKLPDVVHDSSSYWSKAYLNIASFDPNDIKWPEWRWSFLFFYKFLKKLNATRKLPKTAKVMLAVWIEADPAVCSSTTGASVVGGGFGSSLQHTDCVPFVLPGQQNWPKPRSWHPKWEMHGNLANSV